MTSAIRSTVLVAVLVSGLGLAACQRSAESVGEPARQIDLARVALNRTTPAEVETLYGPPDVRESDGSLVYQGVTVGSHPESVTFRFSAGVLARICRARS